VDLLRRVHAVLDLEGAKRRLVEVSLVDPVSH
jgi:hypothetical protein